MKKNTNILEYVEKYKYKYGISYATDGGSLVKTLGIITGVVWVYTFFMTMLFILGTAMNLKIGFADFDYIANAFITIIVGAAVMIAGAALYVCRLKIAGCAAVIIAQPFMVFSYSHLMKDASGISLNLSFYWRHAVPAAVLALLAVWIIVVLIRAKVKTNKLYNTLVEGLYKQYGTKDGEKLTEQQWDEFLSRYNPYKQIT